MYNLWYFVAFYTVLLQNLFFLAIFAVLSHDRFLRFTRYYVEKNLAKNSARGEKMTNMRYGCVSNWDDWSCVSKLVVFRTGTIIAVFRFFFIILILSKRKKLYCICSQ